MCDGYRQWPEGGLQQLRELHELGWPYFNSLVMLSQAGATLSPSQCAYGLRFVVASLWVYTENARPMALEKLTLTGPTLMLCNYILFAKL